MSIVGITRSTYVEIHKKIGIAIERGGGIDLNNDDNIVIKINLCNFRMPDTGAVTHPAFLDASLSYLRSLSKRLSIFVVESNATVSRPDRLVRWLGLKPIIEKHNAKWVNLTKDEVVKKRIKGHYFDEIKVPKIIADSDYMISMPKLKTSSLTKITCCLKNQFGCIPVSKKIRFHPVLDDVIADACLAMKPNFCIVDGILGMGGVKGPDLGTPIQANLVITGKDPVSVDTVCAKIMGFNPRFIRHLRKAEKSGVGRMSYKQVGEDLALIKKSFEFNHLYGSVIKVVTSLK